MNRSSTFLRSFLFVPAGNDRLLNSALTKNSDCVILDLEDGLHRLQKNEARDGIVTSMQRLKSVSKIAAVRINADLLTAISDLKASVCKDLDVIVVPKVEHPRDLQLLDAVVSDLESIQQLPAGKIRFLLQIESAAALPRLHEIATASPRNFGMMLGSEDFSLDCGCMPSPDALYLPSLMVVHAARAARIQPIGFIGSIADLGTAESFQPVVDRARGLGFRGAVVVHPKFIDVVNTCYTPNQDEIEKAQRIVDAFEAADAQGLGAIRVDELMIDKPVYKRSVDLLNEYEAIKSLQVQTKRTKELA